jgi:predicted permease
MTYRLLLLLLPRRRRVMHGAEMQDVFAKAMHTSRARGGRWSTVRLWLREVIGMVKFSWRERFQSWRPTGSSDIRWAWRGMRARGWSVVFSIGLLAVAIAANGIVFSAVDALVLNPAPYPELERIVNVVNADGRSGPPSVPKIHALRLLARPDAVAHLVAHGPAVIFVTGQGAPERIPAINATPGLFDVHGVMPRWGRPFSPQDASRYDVDTVVIAESLATEWFGSPEAALGRQLDTPDVPLLVVGVMARQFQFPDGRIRIWRALDPAGPLAANTVSFSIRARLHPDRTLDATATAMRAHLTSAPGAEGGRPFTVGLEPLGGLRFSTATFWALLGAAGCLLLTACANIASIELASAFGRSRTYAIQRSLGASRWSIARGVMLEGVMLVGAAAVLSVGLALVGLDALATQLPPSIAILSANPIDLDGRAMAFMLIVAGGVWFAIAIPVLLFASDTRVLDILKRGGTSQAGSKRASWGRRSLTVAQVALTVVLLIGGLLYTQTYLAKLAVEKGFDSSNLATVSAIIPPQMMAETGRVTTLMMERLSGHDGVVEIVRAGAPSSLATSSSPLHSVEVDGVWDEAPDVLVFSRTVPHNYLKVINAPVLEGRHFESTDTATDVIISEPFARRFWPEGAVGRTFRTSATGPALTVIGVTTHLRTDNDRLYERLQGGALTYMSPRQPAVPRPPRPPAATQSTPQGRRPPGPAFAFSTLLVRLDSADRLPHIVSVIRAELPQFIVSGTLVDDEYAGWEASTRLQAQIVGAFSVLAFLTALVGIFGVMAFLVGARTRELGVRVALGATRRDVVSLVLGSAWKMTMAGAVVGVGAAFGVSTLIETQLFGVSATDPRTYAIVAIIVCACAMLAAWHPAHSAARVDPAITLRSE